MILSILIPSLHERVSLLIKLLTMLDIQIQANGNSDQVEILVEADDRELTTGAKRNKLLNRATGEYVVFVDDDDSIAPQYIREIMWALRKKPDVIGFDGWMETNGQNRQMWYISKDFPYETRKALNGQISYFRFNNHLSPIKREIAQQIGYKDITIGEDYDYALRLKESGLIKTEVRIEKELYHYHYNDKK